MYCRISWWSQLKTMITNQDTENQNLKSPYEVSRRYYQSQHIPIMSMSTWSYIAPLLKKLKAKSILEIGTAVWYGTMMIGDLIQTWWWQIWTYEISYPSYHHALGNIYARVKDGKSHIHAYHLDFLQVNLDLYLSQALDFVWIDAHKQSYPLYLQKIIPYLSPHAVCLLDDMIIYPDTQDAIRNLAKTHGLHHQLIHLSDGDGIFLVS